MSQKTLKHIVCSYPEGTLFFAISINIEEFYSQRLLMRFRVCGTFIVMFLIRESLHQVYNLFCCQIYLVTDDRGVSGSISSSSELWDSSESPCSLLALNPTLILPLPE